MRFLDSGPAAIAVLFAASMGGMPKPSLAAERVYYYVDENGVYHFSNVPADARYQPLAPGAGPTPLPPAAAPTPLPPAATVPPRAGARPQATGQVAVPSAQQLAAPPGAEAIQEDLEVEPETEGR
jgi:hypothetical protein